MWQATRWPDESDSDIRAIKANNTATANDLVDCDYIEYSSVPDQTGAAFWSILNRIFISEIASALRRRHSRNIVFECVLLTVSELGVPRRLFEEFIPILGPAHGLGGLGVFECLSVT